MPEPVSLIENRLSKPSQGLQAIGVVREGRLLVGRKCDLNLEQSVATVPHRRHRLKLDSGSPAGANRLALVGSLLQGPLQQGAESRHQEGDRRHGAVQLDDAVSHRNPDASDVANRHSGFLQRRHHRVITTA